MGSSWLSMALAWTLVASASGRTPTLEGVWRSQGYGNVFEIKGPTVKAFEVTATTCVPGFTARRNKTTIAGREATFTSQDRDVFFIRAGGSSGHKLLHSEGSASDVRIDRLPRLPAVCDDPTPDTPTDNFEVFARTWAEHYISFDLKNTDWAKVVEANRSHITPKTTAAELFDIFERMIGPFNDTHTLSTARQNHPGDFLPRRGYHAPAWKKQLSIL